MYRTQPTPLQFQREADLVCFQLAVVKSSLNDEQEAATRLACHEEDSYDPTCWKRWSFEPEIGVLIGTGTLETFNRDENFVIAMTRGLWVSSCEEGAPPPLPSPSVGLCGEPAVRNRGLSGKNWSRNAHE